MFSLIKSIISYFLMSTMIVTSVPAVSVPQSISTGSVPVPVVTADNASLVLNRPMASVVVTEVTRVAYAANSMRQPSGNNSVIVSATPSGVPYTSGSYISHGYGGETPAPTMISFTPGVELTSTPTVTCSNTTVTFSNVVYSNGTYVWSVTGGTATVGTTLIFSVNYSYSEVNSTTGKTYTHNFQTQGTSFVQAIASPAGVYSTKRTYEDFVLGTSTKNRSYIASYVLGANTIGTFYNNGTGTGSEDFTGSQLGWTAEYGSMKSFSDSNASRQYNVCYGADENRPMTYVYMDKSIHSTLSDLNLRLQTVLLGESDDSDEQVSVSVEGVFVQSGIVKTFDDSSTTTDPANTDTVASQLGIETFSGSVKGEGQNFLMYFSGVGPTTTNTTTDYTVAVKYNTPAGWNGVYVGHSLSLEVLTYDKGALRTLVEEIHNNDPTVMTIDCPEGEFKGYNPQNWYYSSGWETFLNSYNAAKAYLDKPDATQAQIDSAYSDLTDAYSGLVLQTADYSLATAYYNQALNKTQSNYTLASWAKLRTAMESYSTDYSILYQPAVDKMAMDIKTAMDNLVEANANYSQLLVQISNVNRLMENSPIVYGVEASQAYTNWSAVASALTNSGCVYNSTDGYVISQYLPVSQQATVDGYVLILTKAINNLTLASASYTAATKAESSYKLLTLSYIVDDVAQNLTSSYNALVALHGLDISHQTEIDAATAALNYWLNEIEYKPADTTAAVSLITYASTLDRSAYSDFTAVDNAVANLQSKLTLDIRGQAEINRYTAALQSAIDSLTANRADYSAVDAAIASAEAIENNIEETYADTYGFTASEFYSNWSVVENAINSVVRGLDANQQSVVNSYAATINLAVDNLTENRADYSRVTELQTQAYDIISNGSNLYTQSSIDNLTTAYINVSNNLKISKQAIVDGYADAISQAIEDLEYLSADYSAVNTQIAAANTKLALNDSFSNAHPGYSYYSNDSISALEVAIAAVVEGLDIRSQATVTGYANDIKNAISGLVLAGADYSAVDIAISQIPADTSLYTSLSVATLNATVNSVNRTYKVDKQSTVDKYVTSINNAIAGLKYKDANYSAVTTALSRVPSDSTLYTADSWAYLQTKIGEVVYNLDITHQSEVDTYAQAIETAILLLKFNGADYDAVDQAIAQIPSDLSIYTQDTVDILNNAVDAVVRDLDVSQQSTVDGYAQAIEDAIEGLTLKDADYSLVNEAVTNAQALIETEKYTDESVEALESVIDSVDYNLSIAQQSTIDGYAAAINAAADALIFKDADYTDFDIATARLETLKTFDKDEYNTIKALADVVLSGQNINYQATIDEATDNINSALDSIGANYSAVDTAITNAQQKIDTGWYTDDTVEAVETAIDSVIRNLNFEHQNEVDIFAQSIVNADKNLSLKLADYTELQNILNLLDNSASEIYTNIYTNYDEVMANITSYRANTIENNMDLTIDRQSEVDTMASTLQGYIDSLIIKVALEAKEGSTTVIKNGYIYGLRTGLTKSIFERDYVELTNVTVTYDNSASSRYIGTGTTVIVTSNITNEVIAEYYIVIFGDINGDSLVNAIDINVLSQSLAGLIDPLEGAAKKAANLNSDRVVSSSDLFALTQVTVGLCGIDQASGVVA